MLITSLKTTNWSQRNCEACDAPLSSLLDPLEGLSVLNCGKLELEGCTQLPALKGGKKGMLEVPGFD